MDTLIRQMLDRLFDAYGRQKGNAQYRAYEAILQHSGIPAPILYAAAEKCVLTSKFFPSVAEIVHAAGELSAAANSGGEPNAEEAWEEVVRATDKYNWTQTPEWSCPAVGRTLDAMGGWLTVCKCSEDEWGNFGARYRKLYEGLAHGKRSHAIDDFLLGGRKDELGKLVESVILRIDG